MQQLIPLILTLADLFDRFGLRHAFGGALANNYWGVVRATVDVDCLVLIPALQYQCLADELNQIGFVMRDELDAEQPVTVAAMRRQIEERKLCELLHQGLRSELFVPFLPLQDEILRRAVQVPFEHRQISVTTAEDLILLKMAFHRDKDLLDVRGILWVQRARLDWAYLRSWSERMLEDAVQHELEEMIDAYRDS